MTKPPISLLHERFTYEPYTGLIRWKFDDKRRKAKAGALAGCPTVNGYSFISVNGHKILAHRAAWAMFYGKWPTKIIDHKNRIRTDNRIENLREATYSENLVNTHNYGEREYPRNITRTVAGNYQVRFHGRAAKLLGLYCIGTFDSLEEAKSICREYSLKIYGQFSPYLD